MPSGAQRDGSRTSYLANCRPAPNGRPRVRFFRCRNSESSADDLGTGRGVVLGRAVATLRSVETHPLAWRIRLVGKTRPPLTIFFCFEAVRGSGTKAKFFTSPPRAW